MRVSAKRKKPAADWARVPLHDELGDALRAELLRWPGVELRPMMGTLSFRRRKQMLGCYVHRAMFKGKPPKWAPQPDEPPFVWVRLKPAEKEKALRRPHVRESAANRMKAWVEVPLASRGALQEAVMWLGRSYEQVMR